MTITTSHDALSRVATTLEQWVIGSEQKALRRPWYRWLTNNPTVSAQQYRDLAAMVAEIMRDERSAVAATLCQARPVVIDPNPVDAPTSDAPAAVKPAKAKCAAAPRKARGMTGEEFSSALGAAQRAIIGAYGLAWHTAAPIGETAMAAIPARLRSYKTERGTIIKMPTDHRIPAAPYWPDGAIPEGVALVDDYARHDAADAMARLRKFNKTPCGHSDEWHLARGYVQHDGNGVWVNALELHNQLAHQEGIELDRAYRAKVAADLKAVKRASKEAKAANDECVLADAAD